MLLLRVPYAHIRTEPPSPYMVKDPLGKDAPNPVPNTDWLSGVC